MQRNRIVGAILVYSFEADNWTKQIAAVSTRPEFQRATVRIEDHSLLSYGDYDVETGTQETTGDPVVYEGQARLIPIRWGTFTGGESQSNATTLSAIRVQIPNALDAEGYGDDEYTEGQYATGLAGRVKRGCKIFVITSPRNPALEGLILTITSDVQGSSAAARTFEAALDADVAVVPSGIQQ